MDIIEEKLDLIRKKESELIELKYSLADDYTSLGFSPTISYALTETHFPEIVAEEPDSPQIYIRFRHEHFKLFAKKEFNFNQIQLIKDGIKLRLNVSKYAKEEYSYKLMRSIYGILKSNLAPELEDRIINLLILENI